MKSFFSRILFTLITMMFLSQPTLADDDDLAVNEVEGSLSVMVLGSGGPIATAEGRASAGYLIFTDGKPRILMDVGGGTFQRLAKSGTNIKDLDIILLSHLHADHTGDLTSVVKTMYFHNNLARAQAAKQGIILPGRSAPINIYGPASSAIPRGAGSKGVYYPKPDGSDGPLVYPATTDYVHDHYSIPKGGVERYLKAFVAAISDDDGPLGPGGSVSNFAYTANDLSSRVPGAEIETVLDEDGLVIKAIAVDHGPVPAVAFRVEYKGHSIVYSGDTGTKGMGPNHLGRGNMAKISQNADILIYDTAVMERGDAPANPLFHILHTQPSLIAGVAIEANVKKLVLSHLTPVTSPRLDAVKAIIEGAGFKGKIISAKDLKVYNLDDDD
ncbi:MAG TPA: MBL fold metallo-hydrolase [Gammaproteobacteria bacterium]|nr:MBL fold metallo-hydrolase [Gammaproteobacteria bacterium]